MKYSMLDPNTVDYWDEAGKGSVVAIVQHGLALPNIVGTFKFYMYCDITMDNWVEMIVYVTSWEIDGAELLKISERVINLQRMFNVCEGSTPKDDFLPTRVMTISEFGKYSSEEIYVAHDFQAIVYKYYQAHNWDLITSLLTSQKSDELGL